MRLNLFTSAIIIIIKRQSQEILYGDLSVGIDWGIPERDIILSEKDKVLPSLEEFRKGMV